MLEFPCFETTSGIAEFEGPEELLHDCISDNLKRKVMAESTYVAGLFEIGPHGVNLVQDILDTHKAKLA